MTLSYGELNEAKEKFGVFEGGLDTEFVQNLKKFSKDKLNFKYLIDGFYNEASRFENELKNNTYPKESIISRVYAEKLGRDGFPALKAYMIALLDNGININLEVFSGRALTVGNKLLKK